MGCLVLGPEWGSFSFCGICRWCRLRERDGGIIAAEFQQASAVHSHHKCQPDLMPSRFDAEMLGYLSFQRSERKEPVAAATVYLKRSASQRAQSGTSQGAA